jgi:hypothetical protein
MVPKLTFKPPAIDAVPGFGLTSALHSDLLAEIFSQARRASHGFSTNGRIIARSAPIAHAMRL